MRIKRRTAALGAAVTALVALVAASVVIGDAPGRPSPPAAASAAPASLDDLPMGPETRVPWWQDGRLHVGQTTIETRLELVHHANGTTVVGRSHVTRGSAWFLVRGSSLERLVTSRGPVSPEVSADGRTVVWVEAIAEDRRRITAYDVASGAETGSIEVPVETFCCTGDGELYLRGVTTDGRVVWSVDRTSFVWRPGEPTAVRVDMPGHQLAMDNWPGGLMWQGHGDSVFELPGVLATVSETGGVQRIGRVPTEDGRWSPDGSSYAYAGQADGRSFAKAPRDHIWVQDIDSRETRLLDLPGGAPASLVSLVAWESRTAVIVGSWLPFDGGDDQHAGLQWLVRCDTGTGACERVPGSPAGVPTFPT
ncbi:hypothetical protein [Nocardioides sp. LHG3406-4]|uniref:hypothetical protein n=1 Tax=Nocardioides sp. LHG3406-4 TaxID=2804575 RepID=UPI003CEC7B04